MGDAFGVNIAQGPGYLRYYPGCGAHGEHLFFLHHFLQGPAVHEFQADIGYLAAIPAPVIVKLHYAGVIERLDGLRFPEELCY